MQLNSTRCFFCFLGGSFDWSKKIDQWTGLTFSNPVDEGGTMTLQGVIIFTKPNNAMS